MNGVKIIQRVPVAFESMAGGHVRIDPGVLIGNYAATSHVDSLRKKASNRFLRFAFATAAVDGYVYRYQAFISIESLWPRSDDRVRHMPRIMYGAEAGIQLAEADAAAMPSIQVDYGDRIVERTWREVVRCSWVAKRTRKGLDAELTLHTGVAEDRNLAYRVPLDRLLWKCAPVYTPDDLIAEKSTYVDFERIRKISIYDEQDGLVPGPIIVSNR